MYGHGDEIADGAVQVTDGPFAGWMTWPETDPYETLSGPYFFKHQPDGSVICAMRAEQKHMNGGNAMHGGCMMTFADFSLFALSRKQRGAGHSVTVSFSSDFVGPAYVGELVSCTGEVVRAGGSLIFIRGLLQVEDRTILTFSGVIKRVRERKTAG